MVMPGFEPRTGAKKANSPANVLMANIAAVKQVRTATESVLFIEEFLIS
jgi:hypothetical protein